MTVKTQKVHHNFDLLGQYLLNWGIQTLASDPGTTYARIYYNSATGKIRSYSELTSSWSDVGSTVAADSIDNTLLANMTQGTIKGRAAGAGTGDPTDLTGSQVKTILAIVAADVSDFNTAVRTNRLDQMAAPTSSVSFNSQKITSLDTPVSGTDAANKNYVDATAAGIDWKASVRVATTATGTLSTAYENGDTIDGVTLATGDRILIKDQSTGSENGLYTVNASGAPTRATDADVSAEVTSGIATFVEEGTVNADTGWTLTTNNPITLGSTSLTFTQFTALGQVTAGSGLTKTGGTLNVGAGTGITVNADDVAISTSIVVRKYVANLGDNSTTDLVVNHALGTRDVIVGVVRNSSPYDAISVYSEATDTNNVTIFFPTAPSTNEYRVIVHG